MPTVRRSQKLRALLKILREHPEVAIFEGEVDGVGYLRLEMGRPAAAEEEDDHEPQKPSTLQPSNPVDWRWGT